MSITLNSVVFTFNGFLSRISQFLNTAAGVPQGFRRLTCSIDEPGAAGKAYKVRWKLKLPETVDAASCLCPDGMVQDNFADVVVTVSRASTTAQRAAMAASLKDLAASVEFKNSIELLVSPAA